MHLGRLKRALPESFPERPHHELSRSRTTPEPSPDANLSNVQTASSTSMIQEMAHPSSHRSCLPVSGQGLFTSTQTLQTTLSSALLPVGPSIYSAPCPYPRVSDSSQEICNLAIAPSTLGPSSSPAARASPPEHSIGSTFATHHGRTIGGHNRQQQPTDTRLGAELTSSLPVPKIPQLSSILPSTMRSKTAGSAALKSALRKLAKTTSTLPALNSAVDLLSSCVDVLSISGQSGEEYEELADSIATSVQTLEGHLAQRGPVALKESVLSVITELKKQAEYITAKQGHARLSRYMDAEEEIEDILRCYRRIGALLQQLNSDATLSVWKITHETHGVASESLHVASQGLNINKRTLKEHLANTQNTQLEGMQPVKEARYNSGAKGIRRTGCTPGTRAAVMEELLDWVDDVEAGYIYWINGMAGTGKTTIAYSLCEVLETTNQLGAAFFCSRLLPGCRDASRIVPTIAYQLARRSRTFRHVLCRVLDIDPDICSTGILSQFENLICKPLLEVESTIRAKCLVIVIDALDECTDRDSAQLVLSCLLRFAANDPPVKLAATCRPEPGLLGHLLSNPQNSCSVFHLHYVEQSVVEEDIKIYLNAQLSSTGVSGEQISFLAKRSGRLFIYAATIIQYLRPSTLAVNIQKRLNLIVGTPSPGGNKAHEPLDVLYTTILSAALDNQELEPWEADNIKLVLHTVLCAQEPMTLDVLSHLLRLESVDDVRLAIEPLRSVLQVIDETELVATFHTSFVDYMHSYTRSGRFWCNGREHHGILAQRCLEQMKYHLRFNPCNLKTSFTPDEDIPEFRRQVELAIPPCLIYACKHWSEHLAEGGNVSVLAPMLQDFLNTQVLFWLEVMSLKQILWLGPSMLSQLHMRMKDAGLSDSACALCLDAQKFAIILANSPVRNSTPHIYVSALALWNRDSALWRHYGRRINSKVKIEGSADDHRRSSSLAEWKIGHSVTSAAISYDGRRIVSSSSSHAIYVWDTYTGILIAGPLTGHSNWVNSVAFSPNGAQIASGSGDNTIQVWNVYTGQAVGVPFKGHHLPVTCVIFSPDCLHIASGSGDCTVRIWDVNSGQTLIRPFEGHTDWVRSVAYSPDGNLLVSGSDDCTVRIWDVQTGNSVTGPFEGHTEWVSAVAFSSDGTRIASGSRDTTIRQWDVQTGRALGDAFEGHSGWITSVAFSPDGGHIISGSGNCTACVWDTETGRAVDDHYIGHTASVILASYLPGAHHVVTGCLDGIIRIWDAPVQQARFSPQSNHILSPISSTCFAPDSRKIISGYENGTICTWDAHTGELIGVPFKAHAAAISSVAVSPNGIYVASGSYDNTLSVWSLEDGHRVAGPLEGHTHYVRAVAYSPNGQFVVSGSFDHTLRVWNIASGTAGSPFQGHTDVVYSVAYSPDGSCVVSGSKDRTIRVWTAQTGQRALEILVGHTSYVLSVAFSPNGSHIISGSADHTIRIWDAQTGHTKGDAFKGHSAEVISVAYSPDGSHVLSGSADGVLQVWDAETGHVLAGPFHAHTKCITSVVYSPDGSCFASSCLDGVIRVWPWPIANYTEADRSQTDRWTMDKDGWLVTPDSSLLFWVPRDLRAPLKWPQNIALITHGTCLGLDFTDAAIGPRWTECFDQSNQRYTSHPSNSYSTARAK